MVEQCTQHSSSSLVIHDANKSQNPLATPATSPPTPLHHGETIMTRSRATRTGSPTDDFSLGRVQYGRVEKSAASSSRPRPKKAKKKRPGKSDGAPAVELDRPLSELVKKIDTVQDTDIDAYVRRSPQTRRDEVNASKDKKVKRPMNAFMLYRKANQNRAKEWRKHDNHQIISQLCGISWAMESQEERNKYDEWAKIERENHKAAFPDYKFAPAKAGRNKKGGAGAGASRSSPGGGGRPGNRGNHDEDTDAELEAYEPDFYSSSAPQSRSASRAHHRQHNYRAGSMGIYPEDPNAEYFPPNYHQFQRHQASAPPQAYGYHQQSPVMSTRLSHFGGSAPGQPMFQQDQFTMKQSPANYGSPPTVHRYWSSSASGRPPYQSSQQSGGIEYGHQMQGGGGPYTVQAENVYRHSGMSHSSGPQSYQGTPVDPYVERMESPYPPPSQHPHHHQQQHHYMGSSPHPGEQQQHHAIDPSLMQPGDGYDGLGLLGLGDPGVDGGAAFGGAAEHHQTTGVHPAQTQHHPDDQQHFEAEFHASMGGGVGGGGDLTTTTTTPWGGEGLTPLSGGDGDDGNKLTGGWEINPEDSGFQLDTIAAIDGALVGSTTGEDF
ncbi:hypothetical protein F4778DRAFT_358995 [Xylariomycetidae sp. FL2044]|nr:hypothetical protein F4778DRAFT_358995 [Xylariomycetidae sp. FL2044]